MERNENVAAFFQVKNIEEEKPALAKVNLKLERFLVSFRKSFLVFIFV